MKIFIQLWKSGKLESKNRLQGCNEAGKEREVISITDEHTNYLNIITYVCTSLFAYITPSPL